MVNTNNGVATMTQWSDGRPGSPLGLILTFVENELWMQDTSKWRDDYTAKIAEAVEIIREIEPQLLPEG